MGKGSIQSRREEISLWKEQGTACPGMGRKARRMGLGAGAFVALMMRRYGASPQVASVFLSDKGELFSS